ncbi:MSMEG_0569 family flavin-dependent oxidoreductase [Pseudomonas sp. CCI3.2]|uniref:MSMEG_0569 family flavin-dependent oxidoreductase n=1 Tax=unclassified Pseudomonas TaxID=196821 RepID=UPI002AC8D95B|nr:MULTISPECIES: MSMEG_0569 family flavin-dependent oxidoreductase [unclassified Pseudomonas]MEB0078744.1 MSMEG_0569 family flavin-dependent oxidoreductase [Pseudomonas sp. MH10out]MEB0093520.1 MSMEG_0569 family flavin-dependent oxidoreductase [Pseudomonas sp. CCI4.2]MEB0100412.1 MSMEG_0569 family flavin-dependent oxidoreductase [Pseudomonas sp. CCI3.2]MEB0129564.1 MSMEG_0569 family flavin-dependent oxidoreductase [Pseudomonas sp. CCI2.4]MEB0157384.1 MSMEG_0569 family flavin-dependent oxidored
MVHLTSVKPPHHSVIVVGGGQAGLSASYYLQQQGIDHLLLEKHSVTHAWRHQRWDAFSLVTPNWQCALPGYTYSEEFKGQDPHGFMKRDEINLYLAGFAQSVNAPVLEGVTVQRVVPRANGGYEIHTSKGEYTADKVIVASGGYHTPIIPRLAERLPAGIQQIHSEQYRNPQALPAGNVLVVGSGQSGAQIAEDLHLAGRKVYLAVGDAPRCARFYRGKDVVDWLAEMGYYDIGVDTHPLREGVRDNTNHYVTGRDGGRDIDLRQFAVEGMQLFGRLDGLKGTRLQFSSNLSESLDSADAVYNRINTTIDGYIEKNAIDAPAGELYAPVWTPEQERSELDLEAQGITSIIWCIGFTPDFTWVEAPVFNGRGHPGHQRGVTAQPGLYFLGLPWLYTWGSGRFSGVARDAEYVVEHIAGVAEKKREARLALAR